MKNPSIVGGFLKIGLTYCIDSRIKSLSRTSVPDDYEVLAYYSVKDMAKTESYVFSRLKDFRYKPKKEFFTCDFRTAHDICLSTQKYVNNLNRPYSGKNFLSDEALDQLVSAFDDYEPTFED